MELHDIDNNFQKEVTQIEEAMAELGVALDDIETIQNTTMNSVGEQSSKKSIADLEEASSNADTMCNQIRMKLKGLQGALRTNDDDYRLRSTQCAGLARKFSQILIRYQKLQVAYRKEQRERMERQYRILYPDATEEEMKQALAEDANEPPVFTKMFLADQQHEEATRTLDDVQSRHKEIVRLAKSIAELQQLFMDMEIIVQSQDSLVIEISKNVESTKNDTSEAAKEVEEAVNLKRQSRKKWIYISCALLILIVIIVLLVYFINIHPMVMKAAEKAIEGDNASSSK